MGIILSRWRKKQSTVEVLEGLEKDIQSIEKYKKHNLDLQKKLIGSLLLYSIIFYIVATIVFYFYYLPTRWKERILYSIPLLLFPVLIWLTKKALHWYFVKRITDNDIKLEELKEKKKTILDEVMEKETYKKAKEILEKFDPEQLKQMEKAPSPTKTPVKMQSPQGQELRQRTGIPQATPQVPQGPNASFAATPTLPRATPYPPGGAPGGTVPSRNGRRPFSYGQAPGPPLPRPVVPRERTIGDKLVEYLVGDGPSNRYALICRQCCSHNGMALKEEFEYLSFRCCYCYTLNEARKRRPNAPRLELSRPEEDRSSSPEQEDIIEESEGTSEDSPTTENVEDNNSDEKTTEDKKDE